MNPYLGPGVAVKMVPSIMVRARALWGLVPTIAVIELVLQLHFSSCQPARRDIDAASDLVRAGFRAGDLIVVAPPWFAHARAALGSNMLPLRDQARPDEAVYERLWEVSIRGARASESPAVDPEFVRSFGAIKVRQYNLSPSAVIMTDFTEELDRAMVYAVDGSRRRPCRRNGSRWRCDRQHSDEWVGTETISDLDHRPRRCIWAHPLAEGQKLRIEFHDVPRGERIEGHTATDYVVGRHCSVNPVDLSIEIDGEEVRTLRHHDCDSWRPFHFDVPSAEGAGEPAEIAFVISAPDPSQRHFCFQAQMRRDP